MYVRVLKCIPLLLLSALIGCGKSEVTPAPEPAATVKTERPKEPVVGEKKTLVGGVTVQDVMLPTGTHLYIYLPEKMTPAKIPVVFIAAAGSDLVTGMDLSEDDQAEHRPYVLAGNAVVAYSLSGGLGEKPTESDHKEASQEFIASKAGLADAQAAMEYAIDNVPQIDSSKIYVAGHSSAGTHALLVAQSEPRVKACIAYAPATDLEEHLETEFRQQLEKEQEGFDEFLKTASPRQNAAKLKVPTFLFHAEDDNIVPIVQTEGFVASLTPEQKKRTLFYRTKTGGHYDAMLHEGIPEAIDWLRKRTGG